MIVPFLPPPCCLLPSSMQPFSRVPISILHSRYKLLESKLESTLKKSLEIKEEKIAALEARLQESSNLNQQLRQELKTVSLQDADADVL